MAVSFRTALTDGYAASIVNSTGWRVALWTNPATGTQFCVAWGLGGVCKMLARAAGATTFTAADGPTSGAISDPHYALSMGFDQVNNELIVFGPMHADPLKESRRPLASLAFGAWAAAPVDPDEQDVTYVQTLLASNGTLLRAYRNGASGNGNQYLKKNNPATRTWEAIHSPWIAGRGYNPNLSPYFNGGLQECKRGRLHSSWCWRETTNWTNFDWNYASSGDFGVTWQNMQRDNVTVPLTRPTCESQFVRAWPIDILLDGLMNTQTMCINEWTGQPILGGWWDSNRDGKSQFNVVSYGTVNGRSTWFKRQCGVETGIFSLVGKPEDVPRMLSQPLLRWYDGVTILLYRSDQRSADTGPGLYANVCRIPLEDATLSDWETIRLTDQDLGDNGMILAPVLDEGHWKRRGSVVQKAQILYQKQTNGPVPISAQPIKIAEIELPAPTGVVTWTDYFTSRVVNAIRGITPLSRPATWRLRLALGSVEQSGNGYAPLSITNNPTNWALSNGRIKWLLGEHAFPTVTGAAWQFDRIWLDDGTGNVYCVQRFTTPLTANVGQIVRFGRGAAALTLSFDGGAGGISAAHAQGVLDDLFGGYADYVAEATTYGAYFQGDPRDEFSVQLTAAPLAIPNNGTRWTTATAGIATNSVTLPIAYEAGATHWAEFTSTDELFCSGPLPGSFGTPASIPAHLLPFRLF